jgi:hypothetical protein
VSEDGIVNAAIERVSEGRKATAREKAIAEWCIKSMYRQRYGG